MCKSKWLLTTQTSLLSTTSGGTRRPQTTGGGGTRGGDVTSCCGTRTDDATSGDGRRSCHDIARGYGTTSRGPLTDWRAAHVVGATELIPYVK